MKVSVIIPLFNKAPYVKQAVSSVLNQTWSDLEILVIDDGSTDDGAETLKSFEDKRIKIFKQSNAGVSVARNQGIKQASGELIAFLDADDIWFPEKLARQVDVLSREPNVVWAASGFNRIFKGKVICKNELFSEKWFSRPFLLKDALLPLANQKHIWTGSVIVRSDVIRQSGGFDKTLSISEDLDLWVRIAVQNPEMCYISDALALYNAGLEESLTTAAMLRDDRSPIFFCRKIGELSAGLDPARRNLLNTFSKRVINVLIADALRQCMAQRARELINSSEQNHLEISISWWLRFQAHWPNFILKIVANSKMAVKKLILILESR